MWNLLHFVIKLADFPREKYKVFASDDSLTLDMISNLLEKSLEPEILSSKEEDQDEVPVEKLRWSRINFQSVVRGFVRMFLSDNNYPQWNDFYTTKRSRAPVYYIFEKMFTQEKIEPLPENAKQKSKWAQLVVGPWVDRLMRVQKTLTGDLVAYLLCKIYGKTT